MIRLVLISIAILIAISAVDGRDLATSNIYNLKEVHAKEIIDKMGNEESVDYDGFTIIGDLDLSVLDLNAIKTTDQARESYPKFVKSPVNITNSDFLGQVKFENIVFSEPANFEGTTFHQNVSFNGSCFEKDAGFFRTEFNSPSFFKEVNFDACTDFHRAQFLENADFGHAQFGGDAEFYKVTFHNDVSFLGGQFDRDARFGQAQFNKTFFNDVRFINGVSLMGAKFYGNATFHDVQFSKEANFEKTEFFKEADFRNAWFEDYARFVRAQFGGVVGISNAKFDGEANFRNSKFTRKARFNKNIFDKETIFINCWFDESAEFEDNIFARDADFSGAQFRGDAEFLDDYFSRDAYFVDAQFKGKAKFQKDDFKADLFFWNASFEKKKLYLNKTKFDRMIVRWTDINESIIFIDATYLSLINDFKELGRIGDANDCYYEYREIKRKDAFGWTWAFETLQSIVCGYGVRPLRIVVWVGALIVLFGGIFFWCKGLEVPDAPSIRETISGGKARIADIISKISNSYSFQCLYFSTTVFIAAKSSEDFKPVGGCRYWVVLERILGWFFFGLFVATMTRTFLG